RCGVMRTSRVAKRTTLLLLRHRFHIITRTADDERQLLAEDAHLVAFAGSPQNPEWLPADAADLLPGPEPDRNVNADQARAILPIDLLQRVAAGDARLAGLRPEDYHLAGEKINEATNHAWNRLLPVWAGYKAAIDKLPASDPGHAVTLNKWLLPLWRTLEYG